MFSGGYRVESSAISRHVSGCSCIRSTLAFDLGVRPDFRKPQKLFRHTKKRSLPIGVFNPPFRKLTLDAMLDQFSKLGIEAVEIGAGGYTGTPQCPVPELLKDPAKAREWKQKFADRGIPIMAITCHANAIHPDAAKAANFCRAVSPGPAARGDVRGSNRRRLLRAAPEQRRPTLCPTGSPTAGRNAPPRSNGNGTSV